MKEKFNFTKNIIAKIVPPKLKRDIYKDSKEPGLILIVSYGGSKVFYLAKYIQGKYHRIKIGCFPALSITEARQAAIELKNQIAKGFNPIEKQPKALEEVTFKDLFDNYINDYAKHNTKSWKDDIAEMDRKAKSLYPKIVNIITRDDIQKIFNDVTIRGKYGANRFLDRLRAVFNKAIEWNILEKNPAAGIKKHKEQSRDRYITAEEAPKFWQAVREEKNQLIKDFVFIAYYTGTRKSNVLSMHWDNISFDNKTWYIPDTKNGDPHLVALVEDALKILNARKKLATSEWVFPSRNSASGHLQEPKKVWKRICQKAGLKNLRLHDLRRTRGSWMAIAGASQYVIGKALNHKSPRSTAIYARLSLDPVREFMEKADSIFDKIK